MSNYVDLKYINILSARLEQFKQKGKNLFNFRCPYCGDSQKDKTKARGYLYAVKNDMFYKCHNCGIGTNMPNFIKDRDQKLYSEYCFEKFKKKPKKEEVDFKPKFDKVIATPDIGIKISELDDKHPAKKFVLDRKIPEDKLDLLYFCDKFMTLVNKVKPGTFKNTDKDYPRLIIPFYDESGKLFAFQGRAFTNTKLRYITIKIDEDAPKIFGLDTLDMTKPFYVVEGPIDSMFLPNCIAMAGSDIKVSAMGDVSSAMQDGIGTMVFDNEPRNLEIIKRMERVIDYGWKICIWPDHVKQKDINDMVNAGITEISEMINKFTYQGLLAKTQLAIWRKK